MEYGCNIKVFFEIYKPFFIEKSEERFIFFGVSSWFYPFLVTFSAVFTIFSALFPLFLPVFSHFFAVFGAFFSTFSPILKNF